MGIQRRHIPYFKAAFSIPGMLADPVLMFGYQDISVRPWLEAPPLSEFRNRLSHRWLTLKYRLNVLRGTRHPDLEIPDEYRVADLRELLQRRGSDDIEIVDFFDPRATLKYDMNQPLPPEHYGRYGTFIDIGSLEHVFNPECLFGALDSNGFELVYQQFSTQKGAPIDDPASSRNVLLWMVARKVEPSADFIAPQQGMWSSRYVAHRADLEGSQSGPSGPT